MTPSSALDEVRKLISDGNGSSRTRTRSVPSQKTSKTSKTVAESMRGVVRRLVSSIDAQITNMTTVRDGLLTLEAVLAQEGGSDGEVVSEESKHRSGEAPGCNPVRSEAGVDGGQVGEVLPDVP